MSETVSESNPRPVWPPVVIPPRRPAGVRAGNGLRVLCVEDDEQTLLVLQTVLEEEGYAVSVATTAHAGLTLLRTQSFHLVVSDYWLPDRTGGWMLREAAEAGLLNSTRVLLVTAEHQPQGVENLKVLNKPLDLDDFLRVVDSEMAPLREKELEKTRESLQQRNAADGAAPKAELVLYISSSSPSSLKALRNMERVLADYEPGLVRFNVCNLSKDPLTTAEEDHVAFTPTLVKRQPGPKVWVLGDLERAEIVHDLLALSGVNKRR